MFRQRKLDEDSVDTLVGVQRLDEAGKLLLRRLLRQGVLDGVEAAFFLHLADT